MPETKEMKHFEEWARDKSPLIRNVSLLVATSVEPLLEFLEMIKTGERIKGLIALPPHQEWLSLYRNHRKVYQGVTLAFKELSEETAQAVDMYEALFRPLQSMQQLTETELEDAFNELSLDEKKQLIAETRARWEAFEQMIMNELTDTKEDNDEPSIQEKKRMRQFVTAPGIIFYFRVWIPCFLLYGEYPTHILRKARHGNEEALDKLLRLDKSVLNDPKIMEIFHRQAVAKATGTITLMTKAIQGVPKAKIEIQRVKYLLAGFLSQASILLNQKLTAAEIHRLYDAAARDLQNKNADSDLIVSPETFEKAVQRARTFWKVLPQPDKK